jgi:thiol-disulfide isomerase/thioredoxin
VRHQAWQKDTVKRDRRGILACVLAAAAGLVAAQQPLAPMDESAYRRLIAAGKGRVILVDFWATWCDPCRAEMPHLAGLAARYRARGFDLVTVSCDEPEQEAGAAGFLEKNGAPLPRYIKRATSDEKFINSVDPHWSGALPALFLYDRQGRLVKSFIGATEMTALEAALRRVL